MLKIKKYISIILSIVIVSSTSATAFASDTSNTKDISMNNAVLLSMELTSKADPFISLGNNGFYITDEDALSAILTENEITLIENQLNSTNTAIKKSINQEGATIKVDYLNKSISVLTSSSLITQNSADEGENRVEWIWFGIRIYMSTSTVNHLLNLGVAGAALAISIAFPVVGVAVSTAVAGYLITEFGTSAISRPIYVDVGLKFPDLLNPGVVGVRGWGFQ